VTFAFTKMNGAGNDFILADNRDGRWHLSAEQVVRLCHRQRGIGADGLMLLVPCASGRADWAWEFYNSDGSRAEMCGNGARCFARFVQHLTGTGGRLTFETAAGVINALPDGDRVTVTLTMPHGWRLGESLDAAGTPMIVHSLNTGVPHAVVFVPEADRVEVGRLGAALRYHPHFAPRGTNVNFVQILAPGRIRVRTYERGVEGETLACGTGVTASALVTARLHGLASPVAVQVQGGDVLEVGYERGVEGETLACGTGVTASALVTARLHGLASPVAVQVQGGDVLEVGYERAGDDFREVRLTGPADFVFHGSLEL
jgi:diaminopimelate epimerase